MATRETLLRIGSLQGTASNVLLLMLALGRPTGRNELALLTGRSKHTIRNALARLEFLGLAQNHSRYNGWALTAYATQGFLADPGSAKSADPAGRAQPELPSWSPVGSSPELPTHAASAVREAHNLHLADAGSSDSGGPQVQTLHLDTASPLHEVQKTHLASNAAPPEVQKVHLADAASPQAADRALPELPSNVAGHVAVAEVQNLHLPHATHVPAPASEVQNVHLDTPQSTGEVQTLHLPSSSSSSSSDQDTKSIPRPEKPQPQTLRADDSTQPRSVAAPATAAQASPDLPASAPRVAKAAVRARPELPSSAIGTAVADDNAQAAIDLLTATGCPIRTPKGKGALDAVEAALAGGWSGDQVYAHVRDWLDYGNRQKRICYPGLFTIARVRACQPAPEPPPKSRDQAARDHIADAYSRTVQH